MRFQRLRLRGALFGLLTAAVGLATCSCSTTARKGKEPSLRRYEFEEPQMGVPFRIVLYAENPAKAHAGARAAFRRIAELNDILSDYESESELNRLTRTAGTGVSIRLSDDLWRVLSRAQEIARLSGGAFDVTAGPYISLWRRARRQHELPDPVRLEQARKAVGYKNLVLDKRTRSAKLLVPKMRLDLGAIAKGYAAMEALRVLENRGIKRAMVMASGDVAAGEPPPERRGWRIEIAPLDVPEAPPRRFVLLKNHGLATSGDVFQYVEINGIRYSHIVDPRTGVGLTDHSLVTVIAPDPMTADALATAVSVLGPAKGMKLVERVQGAAAFVVRKPGDRIETHQTSRFARFVERLSTASGAHNSP
ncbi:MAG TPA: FAD:protein FMN transferase [Verrucomicrobiota bacterium]|nr:FAD:protein FMN transferase [Verrucomicrobiota bacterium]